MLAVGVAVSASVLLAGAVAVADPELCPPDLAAKFRVMRDESLGVWGVDQAPLIGPLTADEKFHNKLINAIANLPGWYPVDGTKRILCGTLERWLLYRSVPPELDLHPYIRPSKSFAPMRWNLPPYATSEGDHIFGEVTPPSWFDPFWRVDETPPRRGDNNCGAQEPTCHASDWVGDTACVYGPWIMERIYRYRVEVHPVQLMWGRSDNGVRVFALGDRSQRFDVARSYRTRGDNGKWPLWNQPAKPVIWVATEVAPTGTASISAVRTNFPAPPPSPSASSRFAVGSGSVTVAHSPDLAVMQGPMCRSESGSFWSLFGVSASANSPNLTTVDLGGDILSRPSAAPAAPAEAVSPSESPEEEGGGADTPTVDLRAVEWGSGPRVVEGDGNLAKTRADWGLISAERVTWRAAPTQRLILQLTTRNGPPTTPLAMDWVIEACQIETTVQPCQPIPVGRGNNDLYVEFDYGRRIAVRGDRVIANQRNGDPYTLAVFIRYPVARSLGPGVVVPSVRLTLSATLRSASGAIGTFKYVMRNVSPDIAAEIQPYDLVGHHGRVPDLLIDWCAGWLRQQGYTDVTRAQLEKDWSYDAAAADVLGLMETQQRRINARVLRMSLLTYLEDQSMDAEELRDIFDMLRRYGDVSWL
jgi:hypothetical protein